MNTVKYEVFWRVVTCKLLLSEGGKCPRFGKGMSKYLTRVGATLFHTLIHIHLTFFLSAYSTYSQHATIMTSLYTILEFF